jgi:8-oxo-dGTP pyrophosphatase MutT (NUDIX family)
MKERPRPWTVLGRRTVYTSPWVNLHRDDVRLPDGSVIDGHHVVEFPRASVSVVPVGADGRILLIDHYRFITDTFGWEAPAGAVDEGEDLFVAAARELHEETGAICERLDYLGVFHPINGTTRCFFHLFVGHGARQEAAISDTNEVESAAWFTPDELWAMIERNELRDGPTLTALLWHFGRESRGKD